MKEDKRTMNYDMIGGLMILEFLRVIQKIYIFCLKGNYSVIFRKMYTLFSSFLIFWLNEKMAVVENGKWKQSLKFLVGGGGLLSCYDNKEFIYRVNARYFF